MSLVIDSVLNDKKIILRRPFFAQEDRQRDRDLHSHDCIEISAIVSGTADHILHFSDGTASHQRIFGGNYMILDTTVSHAYKNCSEDFAVLNLLFHPSFLLKRGEEGSTESFEALVKQLFPEFDYETACKGFVNRIYFDQDNDVLPLAHLCKNSSRKHMPEWHQAVHHALSLILLLSLQSLDRSAHPEEENIIDTVKGYVRSHLAEDMTLTDICAKNFYSLPYVSHRFKELCGCTFEQYVRQQRVKHAGELLLSTHMSVSEIAERCGYTSPRSFGKAFGIVTGISPTAFRKKYQKK